MGLYSEWRWDGQQWWYGPVEFEVAIEAAEEIVTTSEARKRIEEAQKGAPFKKGDRVYYLYDDIVGTILKSGPKFSYVEFDRMVGGRAWSIGNTYLRPVVEHPTAKNGDINTAVETPVYTPDIESTSDYIRRLCVERQGALQRVDELQRRVDWLEKGLWGSRVE